ncbi:MAG: rhodanese-like domain-containing protein [Alphaproteobacteria bacterium]
MSIMDKRAAAVENAIARARAIERERGVTRDSLAAMQPVLIDLARQAELFPEHHFPVPDGKVAVIYHLAEDIDGGFALYASAGLPGKAQPPHNHTTWAIIAGVHGSEYNAFYQRTDNGSVPGQGTLERTHEVTVRPGSAVALMPDDIHSIAIPGPDWSLNLHFYGHTLEDLPDRIGFEGPAGGAYRRFMSKAQIGQPVVDAPELKAMIRDGGELAILDVREEGLFAKGHLLFAASLPLSRLELTIRARVPRLGTRIVLYDDGDGLAQRAAAKLRAFGYRHMAILSGGIAAWATAGFEVFSGTHVPSKAFGEFVEHHYDTPRITASELKALVDRGEKPVILDSRPLDEFRVMSIPDGIDCPGAELVHRFFEAVPSPETRVVVNCAGRTRSIIGAQSLINAGVPNRVVALENGTMGWHLAGLALARGENAVARPPGPAALAKAREAAARVAARFRVNVIDAAEFRRLQADGTRTLYLFDVRSPEEFAAGRLASAVSAPGGQLVQATDLYAPVRNARLVLIDDDGVRARMTASWLVQMGWSDVFVLDAMPEGEKRASGPAQNDIPGLSHPVETLSPAALDEAVKAGSANVVDLGPSLRYREAHIPGAWFLIRSRLASTLSKLPERPVLVLTSSDGIVARLAAPEAAALTPATVKVLEGGNAAWRAAGLAMEGGETRMIEAPDDVFYRPYDRGTGVEEAMREYLRWEVALVDQIERDGDSRYVTA